MCDPVTLLTVASTAVGAYGQYQQGQQQRKIAEYNAKQADLQAQDAIRRGQQEMNRNFIRAGQIRGAQRAGLAASGVELDSGSPLAILADTDRLADMDAQIIAENAKREAAGFGSQRVNYLLQGDVAATRGTNQAFGSLLSGAGRVASSWYKPSAGGFSF